MANVIITPATAQAATSMSNSNEMAIVAGKKAKRTVNQFWVEVNRARKVFNIQLDKSNELKYRCLKNQIGRERDPQKFFNDFQEQVDWLMDSSRYNQQCHDRQLDPKTVATHIVFLGSATLHKVREKGIYDPSVSGDLDLYKDSFMPSNAQDFANPLWTPKTLTQGAVLE